jgi:uncharacterized Tic20 family protein
MMQEARNMQQEKVDQAAASETMAAPTDEWTTAALAHASVLLTLILGAAGGIGLLFGPAVPLAIYLGYRERSRFVAFHALQSLVYQVVGILLYIVFAAVMGSLVAVAWTISGVLSAVLIGLLLMPFALLATLLMAFLLAGAPFAWLGYGLYAAYQVYQGRNFHYGLIGKWLEREVKL